MGDLLSGGASVKKEKIVSPRKAEIVTKPPPAKRRKNEPELVEVDVFDGLNPLEVKKKADAYASSVTAHLVSCIEEQQQRVRLLEQKVKDKEKIILAKAKDNQVGLAKLKEEMKAQEITFEEEAKEISAAAKRSAAVSILQARLQMIEDIEKDARSSWDVEGWKRNLADLQNVGEGDMEQTGGEDDGASKDTNAGQNAGGDSKQDGGEDQEKNDAP